MKITKKQLKNLIKEQIELELVPLDISDSKGSIYGDGGSASMAKSQLFQVAKDAQSLHDKLKEEDELPEWVQSKIAVMADNMASVSDYLQYKIHKHDNIG